MAEKLLTVRQVQTARKWRLAGGGLMLRVLGVDTPELHSQQACEVVLAQQALAFTMAWVGDGKVELSAVKPDKYSGRVDATVTRGGVSLADALIAAGLGRAYSGGTRTAWC